MNKILKNLTLPDNVLAECLTRKELHENIKNIWAEVFPDHQIFRPEKEHTEREVARKKISKEFNEKVFSLNILFFEKSKSKPIGWIMGEQHDFETFYFRNSGFIPDFRRKGIYNSAHAAIVDSLKEMGFERVVSDHLPNNRPMLILKLNNGYIINNMTLDERFGSMVRLVKFLHEDRQKLFEEHFRLPNFR